MHERNETLMRRAANAALAIAFLAGLALPFVGTFFALDTAGLPGENREMAPRPSLSKGKLAEFPRRVDAWFNDHFGFRNSLVRANSRILLRVFGVSSSSDVVLGKAGWLFFAADRIIESRRGILPFADDELRAWQIALEERRDWLAARGIRYVFMISPEKSSLYAEFLPDELAPVSAPSRLDQFVAWMRAHSTVDVLDLRESLNAAKAEGLIWYRTDTHWNDEGAFAAHGQIAGWLTRQFTSATPVGRDAFERRTGPGPAGDLAGLLALLPEAREECIILVPKTPGDVREAVPTDAMNAHAWFPAHAPVVFTCDNAPPLRAVVLHDSFFLQMRPFLSRDFARTTFIWWVFPADVIADERPHVVIEETAERVLSRPGFFPANEPPVAGFKATK